MEFFRRSWMQIGTFLDRLDRSTKVAVLSVLIAGFFATFLVLQYAGSPEQTPITPFATGQQGEIQAALEAAGIETQTKNGQLVVAKSDHANALAVLQRSELLKADTSMAWEQYLDAASPWESNAQKQKRYLIALQNSLSLQISGHPDVQSANVTISTDDKRGFGRNHQKRSASVSLTMKSGRRADKRMATAFADAVSGAITGMNSTDVNIVDVGNNWSFTPTTAIEGLASDTLEHINKIELLKRKEIERLLQYIPGVIVAVNVNIDPTARSRTQTYTPDEKGDELYNLRKDIEQKNLAKSGSPGVASNAELNIEGSGTGGSSMTESISETRRNPRPLGTIESSEKIGRLPQQINVSINVPRQFFIKQWMRGKPADAPEPTDEEIKQYVSDKLAEIENQVKPQVLKNDPGQVVATMIPDAGEFFDSLMAGRDQGMLATVTETVAPKTMVAVVLSLLAVGLMFMMARKATQHPSLPTAEELAGVPPQLPADDDLFGEAAAQENEMAGVEVDDEELHYRKIAEQISEMVKSSPDEAGNLIGRWVGVEE